MKTYPLCRSGFTLVELLVVIGIIALLISILLPSLNKARQSAQNLAAMSNMRQIGVAMTMYQQSSNGLFPPYSIGLLPESQPGTFRPVWPRLLWSLDLITPAVLEDPTFEHDGSISFKSIQENLKFMATGDDYNDNFPFMYPHFGYNALNIGSSQRIGAGNLSAKVNQLRNPVETIVLTSAIADSPRRGYYVVDDNQFGIGVVGYGVHVRNPGPSVNVLWADGHVTGVQCKPENPYITGLTSIIDPVNFWDRN